MRLPRRGSARQRRRARRAAQGRRMMRLLLMPSRTLRRASVSSMSDPAAMPNDDASTIFVLPMLKAFRRCTPTTKVYLHVIVDSQCYSCTHVYLLDLSQLTRCFLLRKARKLRVRPERRSLTLSTQTNPDSFSQPPADAHFQRGLRFELFAAPLASPNSLQYLAPPRVADRITAP